MSLPHLSCPEAAFLLNLQHQRLRLRLHLLSPFRESQLVVVVVPPVPNQHPSPGTRSTLISILTRHRNCALSSVTVLPIPAVAPCRRRPLSRSAPSALALFSSWKTVTRRDLPSAGFRPLKFVPSAAHCPRGKWSAPCTYFSTGCKSGVTTNMRPSSPIPPASSSMSCAPLASLSSSMPSSPLPTTALWLGRPRSSTPATPSFNSPACTHSSGLASQPPSMPMPP
ncbi:hypothetical protein F5Y16DRAFT_139592 [Xylariaceae sp. FL0255]|nr:hypothetical protein F5Y16DRAFT_139592 [Xylariaceae sp. FL0255]